LKTFEPGRRLPPVRCCDVSQRTHSVQPSMWLFWDK